MEFFSCSEKNQKSTQLLVIPFWEGQQFAENAFKKADYNTVIQTPEVKKDFQAKEGELLFLYGKNHAFAKRLVLLGLGKKEKITAESLRRAYSQLTKACHQKKITEICLLLPETRLENKEVIVGITEGILLSNYTFDQLKEAKKSEPSILLTKVGFSGISKEELALADRFKIISEGVYLARDLVNNTSDRVTPQYLSKFSQNLSRKLPIKTTILTKKQIEKEKMGLLLAVNRGSSIDPAVVILSYRGNPKSKEHIILIGKGITYDTGGLNLKPVASMETMKADMAGGAAVIGTLYVAAKLGLKVNVTGVIPSTENSIDAKSFKPGDVYQSCQGKMIEITNPDAEGRLVLADAITYAKRKLKPTCLIDIATLTGGIDIALGPEACGLFSNDDTLAASLEKAGITTFERVWRFPLFEEYRDFIKSDVADLKNSGGRSASSSVAATFLQEFVENTPWAHLDIASTAYLSEKRRYQPKYGTGFGVRLLVNFLYEISHRQKGH